ncbi:MAG: undecaprenyl/decaprenyl-phosphate alpha-N-acetylglucosaminyl 1-phosphate transferase [Crocinitomicaceae bacterium]|nr:undecaprenyl/decaprenyl-phosphate alpha-N-acetylglucosaminyl 1-phosphate transferase [Crocinitomicaceae bacterium]
MKLDTIFQSLFFFALGLGITYALLPSVINVVKVRRLFEKRNDRSSHANPTPSFGGVAIYISLLLSLSYAEHLFSDNLAIYLITGLTVLFFIGLKDDLTGISPLNKLFAQLLAATFIFLSPHFQIHSMHGFLLIKNLHPLVYLPLAYLVVAFFVNAYNLIDGIDGLAGTLGITFSFGFAFFFFYFDEWVLFYTCLALAGALAAFLRYNLSTNKKIFLGDTGSLMLGFFFVLCVIELLAQAEPSPYQIPAQNFPYVLIALLFIPVLDSLRVFVVRIKEGRSPFSADRNHVHHVVMDYYDWSHVKTSMVLAGVNTAVFILMAFVAKYTHQGFTGLLLVLLVVCSSFLLTALRRKRDAQQPNTNA